MAKSKAAKAAAAATAAATAADYFDRGNPEQNRDGVKRWNRLTIAQRSGVKFMGADFSGCDLAGINLNGVSAADGVSFAGAILSGAQLTGSFRKASFAGAALTGARLSGCIFENADFTRAQLAGVDLTGSDLEDATFAEADLTGANLTDCRLLYTNFSGAILTDAILAGATFSKQTQWPAGFVPPGDSRWVGPGPDPRLSGKGKKAVAHDINGLMARLHAIIDPGRMKRTLDMLKKEKHHLFFEIEPTMVRGIVRSQKDPDLVYSCVLMEDGIYSCATPDVAKCMGLSDEPCKHILVLVIGLARAGLLDPTTADRWMLAAKTMNPRWNKTVQNYVSDSLLKYKGVMAGEVDWRPAETIPEDFYAM